MTSRFLIYGLIDPDTQELRYVGRSSNGLDRPRWHWRRKKLLNRRDKCHSWIKNVVSRGKFPEIEVLENFPVDVTDGEMNESEIFWIAYFRSIGSRLTNMTDGGEGTKGLPSPTKGIPHTQEARLKISLSNKGKVAWCKGLTKETSTGVARQSASISGVNNYFHKSKNHGFGGSKKGRIPWNKGKKGSQKGVPHTEEFKKMMSEKMKNKWSSGEMRKRKNGDT